MSNNHIRESIMGAVAQLSPFARLYEGDDWWKTFKALMKFLSSLFSFYAKIVLLLVLAGSFLGWVENIKFHVFCEGAVKQFAEFPGVRSTGNVIFLPIKNVIHVLPDRYRLIL